MAELNETQLILRSKSPESLKPQHDGDSTSTVTKYAYLGLYILLNLVITMFNKALMSSRFMSGFTFPFPVLLTASHNAFAYLGCWLLKRTNNLRTSPLTRNASIKLTAFSILYSANIAASNQSLHMVTVAFHQVVRALTPLFIIAIQKLVYSRSYSLSTYLSLFPLMFGVVLATYGDYNHTNIGLLLTLVGTGLAAVKTVATNRMQTSPSHSSPATRFGALELIYRVSPLAFVFSLSLSYMHGEIYAFQEWYAHGECTTTIIVLLFLNGLFSIGLNIISFLANKKSGALDMTVAANIKQVATVVLAFPVFGDPINLIHGIGIILALLGGVWYARVEFWEVKVEKNEKLNNGLKH